jgi:hypothetical protein
MVQGQPSPLPTGRQASRERGNWIKSISFFGVKLTLDMVTYFIIYNCTIQKNKFLAFAVSLGERIKRESSDRQ